MSHGEVLLQVVGKTPDEIAQAIHSIKIFKINDSMKKFVPIFA